MSDIITERLATEEWLEAHGINLEALRSLAPSIEALVEETKRAALLEAAADLERQTLPVKLLPGVDYAIRDLRARAQEEKGD